MPSGPSAITKTWSPAGPLRRALTGTATARAGGPSGTCTRTEAPGWGPSPASFQGEHYRFADVWVEPKPFRPDGVRLWLGSSTLHDRLLRRLVRYGHGWNPLGRPTDEDVARQEAYRSKLLAAARQAYPEEIARPFALGTAYVPGVAITFRVDEVFLQTPGPGAGTRLA